MVLSQFIIGLFMLSNIHIGGPIKAPTFTKADGFSHPVEKVIIEDITP